MLIYGISSDLINVMAMKEQDMTGSTQRYRLVCAFTNPAIITHRKLFSITKMVRVHTRYDPT